jgi:hypothetical protein
MPWTATAMPSATTTMPWTLSSKAMFYLSTLSSALSSNAAMFYLSTLSSTLSSNAAMFYLSTITISNASSTYVTRTLFHMSAITSSFFSSIDATLSATYVTSTLFYLPAAAINATIYVTSIIYYRMRFIHNYIILTSSTSFEEFFAFFLAASYEID